MKRPLITALADEEKAQRKIVCLVLPNVQLLDLAGPVQVFDTAARLFGAEYKLTFCATNREIRATQQIYLAHLEELPEVDANCIVLVPGTGVGPADSRGMLDEATKQWLQKSHREGALIASICSGTTALGEAGLLHRRRCTTHWEIVEELQACYPTAHVLEKVLYVQDRGIMTSAGVTSGIDMALWLLEEDYGPRIAAEVARQLVVYKRRSGLERQVSVYLEYRSHLDPNIHRVQDWLIEHVSESISLADLAKVGHMSERSLSRAFKVATGITPHQYMHMLRLEMAAQLVHTTDMSMETVAVESGFGDARQFRRAWRERFGVSPTTSRQSAKGA